MNETAIAHELLEAYKTRCPIQPLTTNYPTISVDEAYRIQLAQIESRIANGDVIVGKKIGLTSKVMQQMFNVTEPDYGHILASMVLPDGEEIAIEQMIQPKIEFEIAFVLKEDVKGPNVTEEQIVAATEYVVPAFEIIDSRIEDWKIRFEDTVADNGSSAYAILGGKPTRIEDVDLETVGMNILKNGHFIDHAAGAAVMGNPVRAVVWLANALSRYDIGLKKGEFVLAGALTAALPVEAGDTFTADFAHLGTIQVSFK
ncbi:2-keto-4-pentenoate hydratase [Lysinibacillus yapensis]|uniref:2-keto-4-pentenoate hydratase n=1 Tax=Ureibacillus yapensis TaxID=2304605 RepID=A0A396SKE3_9BACL|nr:2-keto-4-pentenoate hydratase [Lysinibacillus yapensis]RHW39477.1 2-keto-4-pentenoate hydratase [Lysinibacillus yapensis]